MPTYVAGDIRSIQDYVFGSPRLFEMRGGSAVIDFFDRAVVPELLGLLSGERIFSGGGNFLAVFGEDGTGKVRAADFVDRMTGAFFDLTGGHDIAVALVTTDAPFPQARREIQKALLEAKRRPQGTRQLVSMPFLKRCESCGREPADLLDRPPGAGPEEGRQWIGPTCRRKRDLQRALAAARKSGARSTVSVFGLAQAVPVPLVTERLRQAQLPSDFQELVGEDDLAVVVADGNGLGGWFKDLDRDATRELSQEIDRRLRAALDAATEAAFPNERAPRVQVLICGGDDLVVALPASSALPFASTLLQSFRLDGSRGEVAGLSIGLLLCKASFPFRQAHELAVELLHQAKARCRKSSRPDQVLAALDFHRVLATQVRSLAQERAEVKRAGPDETSWSYGAAGPYTVGELERLGQLAEALRKVPPSQRGRLREILSPRDDGPDSPLDESRRVPRRVLAELETWLGRQEQENRPFGLSPGSGAEGLPRDLLRSEPEPGPAGVSRPVHRWVLADALVLAEAFAATRACAPAAVEEG